MRYFAAFLLLAVPAAFLLQKPNPTASVRAEADVKGGHKYPDFGFLPPPHEYEGRVFHLSQDYPEKAPDASQIPEIAKRDFAAIKKNWKPYMLDVRNYCFDGNVLGGDVEDDWVVQDNKVNKWYHMPWQHFGPTGREGIHGLTKEAPVQPLQLARSQTYTGGQTYAAGFFNEFGGATIGKVWKDHEHPDDRDIRFANGTVICKVLFVDVPHDQVPSLNPPLPWQGYITDNFESTNRSIRPLSLIQMDIMVRHEGAPLGWIFGTYQYNGALGNKNKWENLVPVGLMWGNDPENADDQANPQPTETIVNPKLKETIVNPDKELPPTHLGWNGRLNGPVDNPRSSCLSCHMTAEIPQLALISPLFQKNPPPAGSKEWMLWFRNLKCGDKFDKSKPTKSTDNCLQMAISLQNFRTWRNEGSKILASRYKSVNKPARITPKAPEVPATADNDSPGIPIRRDYPKGEKP